MEADRAVHVQMGGEVRVWAGAGRACAHSYVSKWVGCSRQFHHQPLCHHSAAILLPSMQCAAAGGAELLAAVSHPAVLPPSLHLSSPHLSALQVQPLTVAKLLAAVARREQPGLVLLGKQAIDDDSNQVRGWQKAGGRACGLVGLWQLVGCLCRRAAGGPSHPASNCNPGLGSHPPAP